MRIFYDYLLSNNSAKASNKNKEDLSRKAFDKIGGYLYHRHLQITKSF
ncbi:hypothetical protein HMP0015_1529 [Acinetobacter haemolyticus ATCC 19194]|uniref:Uncharacterized protein n=1 Tax=Acinetobacter haemolyticus ATCC 19194 TaxID=707232 RepID=D4XP87_ACIHA|nr:hypothetical protein HMP0015_1529 [Acinetobacter haemolyticus ATCC 19194]